MTAKARSPHGASRRKKKKRRVSLRVQVAALRTEQPMTSGGQAGAVRGTRRRHGNAGRPTSRIAARVCRVCRAGVNPPERIHWWCRDQETRRDG